jgi:hypothetical protein
MILVFLFFVNWYELKVFIHWLSKGYRSFGGFESAGLAQICCGNYDYCFHHIIDLVRLRKKNSNPGKHFIGRIRCFNKKARFLNHEMVYW